MPDRVPECSDECRALRLLEERVGRVQAAQTTMDETLSDIRVSVEPMRDIVANYKQWKQGVSDFIVRQDQHAIDLTVNLADREKDEARRRSRNWKVLGAAGLVFMGLAGFLGPKVWTLISDDIRLTEEWKTYQPVQSQPVPYTEQQPQPKIQHKSFFQHKPQGVSSMQAPPPQYNAAAPTVTQPNEQ